MKGLYIHIPFCQSKCGYCDFYSFKPQNDDMDSYLKAVLLCLKNRSRSINGGFDTIYFGGGTPSFFGGKRIAKIIACAKECFEIAPDAEITVECNPSSVSEELMQFLSESDVNRISLGVQSAVTAERALLGRKSNCNQVQNAISLAKANGINNISLDLMLGIPNQTIESLEQSLDFIIKSGAVHVSAYMLKLEEGTPLFKNQARFSLPNEDEACDMYLHTVERLEKSGFKQYEVSNFAKAGFESRHNTKYWKDEEYLGIGPAAHSFIDGKRFFYPRDFNAFVSGCDVVYDGVGGGKEEYVMLRLRLSEGLNTAEFEQNFFQPFSKKALKKAETFAESGHMIVSENKISLTPKGFLISNYIIGEIINCL